MENQSLESWPFLGVVANEHYHFFSEQQLDFCWDPLWNWQYEFPVLPAEEDKFAAFPKLETSVQYTSSYPSMKLLPENNQFEDDFGGFFYPVEDDDMRVEVEAKKEELLQCKAEEELREKKVEICRGERALSLTDLSRYFYVPITEASKELNIGLTQLKKLCRELGIPRWPHRKMKSLQSLIKNVEELGREDREVDETQLKTAIQILEEQRKTMEKKPELQMGENTKKLRQAFFKANYRKKKAANWDGEVADSSSCPFM